MILFLLTFAIILLVIGAMSIGVIFGRAPIRGSCGGLGSIGSCDWCNNPCRRKDTPTN